MGIARHTPPRIKTNTVDMHEGAVYWTVFFLKMQENQQVQTLGNDPLQLLCN